MWFVALLSSVACASTSTSTCPEDPEALAEAQSRQVLGAYDRADGAALVEAATAMDFAVSCLTEPLSPRVAVEVHRAKALIAFYEGDEAGSVRSWAAVRVLDPMVRPEPLRWPESHPMWRLYEEAGATSDERIVLERHPPGGWVVDGALRDDVPRFRGFLLQGLGGSSEVVHSAYHYTEATVPQLDWDALDPTARDQRRRRIRAVGTTVSSTMAAGAAASMTLAILARGQLGSVDYEEIEGRAVLANTSASLAVGLATGALTSGLLTWTIHW
ncbi:MAG TPA: hypothetical protein ENK18_11350 [Deltaproteobacteria bacterium]|nr:hypothetical protein [Deltaproteobacteria bacterium]